MARNVLWKYFAASDSFCFFDHSRYERQLLKLFQEAMPISHFINFYRYFLLEIKKFQAHIRVPLFHLLHLMLWILQLTSSY
ncbi:hypothetical protein ACH3XW_6590 [Acanthocheilonema viteae]